MSKINYILRRIIEFFGSARLALGSLLFFGMLSAIVALFFFGWLSGEMLDGDTRRFDETVRAFVHGFAFPALTSLMQLASFLGSTLFLVIFGVVTVIALYLRKHRRGAILFTITTIGATVLLVTLKLAFRRTRPEPFFDTILPASYSFPSGHSLAAFCFYGALAEILSGRTDKLWQQILVWISAVMMILLIGISRIYLGVHHPSDVVAGYAVGLIWVITIAIGDKLVHAKDENVENIKV
ncbi:MAG: phosphatase PAP2 family protein [Pyrinomonadaceae bacterium]|nr:phosphatase PAP2 family protein [Pyrinomonadaceae bacterium]